MSVPTDKSRGLCTVIESTPGTGMSSSSHFQLQVLYSRYSRVLLFSFGCSRYWQVPESFSALGAPGTGKYPSHFNL